MVASAIMARTEQAATAPARSRIGLPIVPDGSRNRPLLLRLPVSGACNNGCVDCLTRPVEGAESAWDVEVSGRHIVVRDFEPTLLKELPRLIRDLKRRGPSSIALLTNGRMLVYANLVKQLSSAGVDRFVLKLFGVDEASHDAHTRVPGSFRQALDGVATARAAGAHVSIAFPLLVEVPQAKRAEARARCVALAQTLTSSDIVEMPEPEVESHGGEYRYDLIRLRGRLTHRYWVKSFFPMVHVNTGPVCNLRCTYCNVHGGDDQRLFDPRYIESMIDASAAKVVGVAGAAGVPTIDFIGGEPTLHPALPSLIRHARSRGFPQITICTNGVLLLKPGFLDELIAAGLTGVRFSFHDHRPGVANLLADTPGLGDRYVEVAEALLARPELRPHIYRIILSNTIDALPDYVRWIASHNKTNRPIELVFGMPSMRGRLFDNRGLYPKLEGLREQVAAAVEIAESLGIEVLLHHSPACLLPTEPVRSACLHIATMQVDALSGEERMMNFEGDARYGEACQRCSGREEGCHGLPAAYFEAGDQPVEAWLRPIDYRASRADDATAGLQ
jgi:MoaA/NifB/PqqE/SkfB family radical SAM enzyme